MKKPKISIIGLIFFLIGCADTEQTEELEYDIANLSKREQIMLIVEEMLSIDILENFSPSTYRAQKIAEDIVFLRTEIFNSHGHFNTRRFLLHNERIIDIDAVRHYALAFDDVLINLIENVEQLSDLEIIVEIKRALGVFNDNHTSLLLTGDNFYYTMFLLNFRWLSDGYYLVSADKAYDHLLHYKLTHVNGYEIEILLYNFIAMFGAENITEARLRFNRGLHFPLFHEMLGLDDNITFTFSNGQTIRPTAHTFEHIPEIFGTPFTHTDDNMPWYEITDNNILYINIPVFFNFHPWVTFQFSIERALRNNEIRAAILDVRDTPGGDATMPGFVRIVDLLLTELGHGNVFYFTNGRSASASLFWAVMVENKGVITMGMPPAQGLYGFARATNRPITLPYLNLDLGVGDLYLSLSGSVTRTNAIQDNTFIPMIQIDHTIDDWINGIDPLYEKVLYLMNTQG